VGQVYIFVSIPLWAPHSADISRLRAANYVTTSLATLRRPSKPPVSASAKRQRQPARTSSRSASSTADRPNGMRVTLPSSETEPTPPRAFHDGDACS
jgi:hypothetical protein